MSDISRLLERDGLVKPKKTRMRKKLKKKMEEKKPESSGAVSKFKSFFGKGGVREKIRSRK